MRAKQASRMQTRQQAKQAAALQMGEEYVSLCEPEYQVSSLLSQPQEAHIGKHLIHQAAAVANTVAAAVPVDAGNAIR